MAIRQGTQINDVDDRQKFSWSGLLNGDTGTSIGGNGSTSDYTVQAFGTFGVGGSVALLGSNNNIDFAPLEDALGVVIAMTVSTKIWRLAQVPLFMKPSVTAGDGTTNLSVFAVGQTD